MRHLSVLIGLLFVLSCGESKPPAADLVQKGEAYYKDRKLVEAMDNFKQYVEYYPDSSQAARCSFMIGFIYANDFQDTLKARQSYQAFLKAYPNADPGLRSSAEWELKHLGQDISNLEFLGQPAAGEAKDAPPVAEPAPVEPK